MSKAGKGLVAYAKGKVGTPYFYGSKMTKLTEKFMEQMHERYPSMVTAKYMQKARDKGMVGEVCVDCSGLIGAYRGKQIGSSQLYQTAATRIPIGQWKSFPDGTVLWRKGHVGVFCKAENSVYEAKSIDVGTVKSPFKASNWKYGLLFADMAYDETNLKEKNPYKEPKRVVKYGDISDDVKWVQVELNNAGYFVEVDGEFGVETLDAVKAFQRSCKTRDSGVVGPETKALLKADDL